MTQQSQNLQRTTEEDAYIWRPGTFTFTPLCPY